MEKKKMLKKSFKFILSSLIMGNMLCANLFAEKLTKEQKEELYKKGTVTVYDDEGVKKGHFEVKFMPGSEKITEDSKRRWKEASDLMGKLMEKEDFWQNKFVGSFKSGLKHVRDVNRDKGLGKVKDDWKDLKEKNDKIDGQFASLAQKTRNYLRFGGTLLGRSYHSVVGTGSGILYSVFAPIGHVIYLPVAAGTKAIVTGSLWPALQYSWNGAAWILVKENKKPQAGDMTVTYIPEEIPESTEDNQ